MTSRQTMELQRIFLKVKQTIFWDDTPYSEYILRTPEEVESSGKAKCADAILYIKSIIEKETNYRCLPIRILIRSDRPIGNTHRDKWVHVLMVVYANEIPNTEPQIYLIEWRWCEMLHGVFGPFNSLVDLMLFIEKVYTSLLRDRYRQLFVLSYDVFDEIEYGMHIDTLFSGDTFQHGLPSIYKEGFIERAGGGDWCARRHSSE